jgi:prepilin-type N-terminal cleavage/methylation domain-containing protein
MLSRIYKNNKGFSLIEQLIVLVLFSVVITITSNIFDALLPKAKSLAKSEISSTQGIIGLEMLRSDLEKTGFGLFTGVDISPPTYSEAVATPASNYNDAPNGIPRAITAGNDLTSAVLSGTDYLVIKATNVAVNSASQCWTVVNGSSASKVWGANDLKESRNDRVVALTQSYINNEMSRKLIYSGSNTTVAYKANAKYAAPFATYSGNMQYYYYGLDNTSTTRTPFNRADYMVKRISGDVPDKCSPAAGVLYKSILNQSDGSMQDIALLDCVADMQVVFGWNTGTDSSNFAVDTYTNADGSSPGGLSTAVQPLTDANTIMTRLKLIKVYILAQDGGYDKNYTNTNTAMKVGVTGETGFTKTVNLTLSDYRNYRWKLYHLAVRPKNLL